MSHSRGIQPSRTLILTRPYSYHHPLPEKFLKTRMMRKNTHSLLKGSCWPRDVRLEKQQQ